MPPEVWGGSGGQYTAANTFFINGKLVFYFAGSWAVQQFTSGIGNKFEWDAVPNPYGDCGSTGMPGGAALVAFKASKNPKEVGKLVDWLTSDAVLEEFSAKTLFLPGHLGLAKKGITYPASSKVLNVFLKEIAKLMPEAYNLQYHPLTGTFNPEMRDRLSQVINGELTLDEAIKKIQQKMDDAAAATQVTCLPDRPTTGCRSSSTGPAAWFLHSQGANRWQLQTLGKRISVFQRSSPEAFHLAAGPG